MASKKVLIAEDSSVIQNLTKKILQIQNYEIFSALGKKELSGDLKMASEFMIDIKSLASGSYILKINSKNNSVFKKFIKE